MTRAKIHWKIMVAILRVSIIHGYKSIRMVFQERVSPIMVTVGGRHLVQYSPEMLEHRRSPIADREIKATETDSNEA